MLYLLSSQNKIHDTYVCKNIPKKSNKGSCYICRGKASYKAIISDGYVETAGMCGSKTKVLCRKWEQINCAYNNCACMTQTSFASGWDINN